MKQSISNNNPAGPRVRRGALGSSILLALLVAGCGSQPEAMPGARTMPSPLVSPELSPLPPLLTSPEQPVAPFPPPLGFGDAPPRFVDVDYIDASAIARISMFRSGVGHDYSDDFETCRSMKHYFQPREGVDAAAIPITAPVSGTVVEVREEWAGTQVAILPQDRPGITLVIFHIAPVRPLAVGDRVTAGERLGSHVGDQTMSDIAVRMATPGGMRLVSYFEVMTDRLFATYQARGLRARADAAIPRSERDQRPLRCAGERFGEAESAADWVDLELSDNSHP